MSQEHEIIVSEEFYKRLQTRGKKNGYNCPSLYVNHLLKELDSDTSQLILLGLLSPEVEARPYVFGKN